MTFSLNTKKIIVSLIALFLGGDVSSLFAADTGSNNAALQQQLQQVMQLQQQAQAAQPIGTQNQTSANQNSATALALTPPPAQQQAGIFPQASTNTSTQALPSLPAPQSGNLSAPTVATNNNLPNPVVPGAAGAVSVQDVSNAAFNSMTQNMLPMNSDQVQRLRQLFDRSQYAASALPNVPARGVISSQFINLAPGSTPPVVRLQQGMVSVLSFLDSTGAPWPIQAYDIGNAAAFNIQWNHSDNTLMFQPMLPYAYANMAIMLQGSSTPVILTLTTGQKAFDVRVDFHVQGLGPNASAPVGTGLPNSASSDLLGVLDGVAPSGSTALQVEGGQVQAWLSNDRLLVRTRYTILSPGWIATMSSADGMKAYQLPKTPLLLASQNGRIVQLKVEGL